MCVINTFDLILSAFFRPIQCMGPLVWSTTIASFPIRSNNHNHVDFPLSIFYYRLLCQMLFRIDQNHLHLNVCMKKERLNIIMSPQRQIHRFASATQRAMARCHKANAPIPSDRWRYKCYILSLRMFPHMNNFIPVYTSNLCMLQKICNSDPWGHTLRWVTEHGLTTGSLTLKRC